jgi:hypothetical protein
LTLTIDPKLFDNDKLEMWKQIKKEFRRFIDTLQHIFKRIGKEFPPYLATIQAQKGKPPDFKGRGNPHIHVLFFNCKRLLDWRKISDLWSLGFIYINRTYQGKKIRYPINYICRYITRTFTNSNDKNKLTQSLVWLFNINSYSTTRHLLYPLKRHSSDTNWMAYYLIITDENMSREVMISFMSTFDQSYFGNDKDPPPSRGGGVKK